MTTTELSTRWGVSAQHVRALIASGELRAFNVSAGADKPRWCITEEAVEQFERARSFQKPPPIRRRRKNEPGIVEFY